MNDLKIEQIGTKFVIRGIEYSKPFNSYHDLAYFIANKKLCDLIANINIIPKVYDLIMHRNREQETGEILLTSGLTNHILIS